MSESIYVGRSARPGLPTRWQSLRRRLSGHLQALYRPYTEWWMSHPRTSRYRGLRIAVPIGVFPPRLFFSTTLVCRTVSRMPLSGRTFLDVGSGSGVVSLIAARAGAQVTAIDISSAACAATQGNATRNGLAVEVIESDLFDNLAGRFDVVSITPPFFRHDPSTELDHAFHAGADFEYFRRLFDGLDAHINPWSECLLSLAEGCDVDIGRIAAEAGYELQLHSRRMVFLQWTYVFHIVRRSVTSSAATTPIELVCPRCGASLGTLAEGTSVCSSCGETFPLIEGIHRFLPADRRRHYAPFLRDYAAVRVGEGRHVVDVDSCRRLPEPTPGGALEWQWKLRRRSWATVRDRVLAPLGQHLTVLDVGAGVGWLSNRLHDLGHSPHAVDLTVDDDDGLGAARHYEPTWPRYQAEMDSLPFADAQADVVVFNASLHYSTDYVRTIGEALRVLRPGGSIVVMDSPIYRHDSSGRQMVAERHADFEQRFGTRSDSVASIEYLTASMLDDITRRLDVRWHRHRTWYGFRWEARPWLARVRRRREPSRFAVLVCTRSSPR